MATNSTMSVAEPIAGDAQHFYRIVLLPPNHRPKQQRDQWSRHLRRKVTELGFRAALDLHFYFVAGFGF